jgi:hypothetical protein
VATTGSDSNPGTQAAPFRTIQKGADVALPGDTVLVGDGIYTDTDGDGFIVYIRSERGGSAGKPITFKSQNKWGAKLDGRSNTASMGFLFYGNYITVQDFEFYGIKDAVFDGTGSNLLISGNYVHDIGRLCTDSAYGLGAAYFHGSDTIVFEKNRFHDIGRYAYGENGCTVSGYSNHDHALYLNGVTNVTIKNNIFYNMQEGWAIHLYPNASTGIYIYNNTFALPNPQQPGHIIVAADVTNCVIANNISYMPNTGFINWYYAGKITNLVVQNNMIHSGTIDASPPPASGVTFFGNTNNTDPKLVNPDTRDFRLQSGSPAIDAGKAVAEVSEDFNGIPRTQGCCHDIGAYEYVSTRPLSAPTNFRIVVP